MIKIYQMDAFTDKPFSGNPAGVVPNADGLNEQQMLMIAKEMNLSETAFVFQGDERCDFEVRFFTPTEEVDLCGHATIATFSLLKELGKFEKDEVTQKTKAGILSVKVIDDNTILMKQAEPKKIEKDLAKKRLLEAMKLEEKDYGISGLMEEAEIWTTGLKDILMPVKSKEALKAMNPDMSKLTELSNDLDVIGLHAFAIEDDIFYARNFAPACGIPEEAATGTSNGALGACLHSKGYKGLKTLSFTVNQGMWMNSPSQIDVSVLDLENPEVWVGGKAIKVIEGQIVKPY